MEINYSLLTFFCLILTLNYLYKTIDANLASASRKWFRSSIVFNYIFFVGTVIHELSHALTALFFGVRVYKVSLFWPQKDENGNYRMGFVEHKKVDPIRTTIIGIAPIFGCAFTTFLVFIWASPNLELTTVLSLRTIIEGFSFLITSPLRWQNYVFLYVALACSLAGDPSDTDKRSLPWLFAIIMAVFGLYYATKTFSFWNDIMVASTTIFSALSSFLMGINAVLFFEFSILLFVYLFTRILKKNP